MLITALYIDKRADKFKTVVLFIVARRKCFVNVMCIFEYVNIGVFLAGFCAFELHYNLNFFLMICCYFLIWIIYVRLLTLTTSRLFLGGQNDILCKKVINKIFEYKVIMKLTNVQILDGRVLCRDLLRYLFAKSISLCWLSIQWFTF